MPDESPAGPDVAVDVAIRFREHDQYGSEERAARALARRLRLPEERARRLLTQHLAVLDTTIRIVGAVPKHATGRTAAYEDVDVAEVSRRLRAEYPRLPRRDREAYVGWVIFWHYLK